MLQKTPPVRSKKLRDSARGQQCQLRLPGVCSWDPETVVLAHPPLGNGGMATKGSDLEGAFCCSACHDVLDGRVPCPDHLGPGAIFGAWILAAARTRAIWLQMGLLRVEGFALPRVDEEGF
ncbi:nuclease domain-containing protein [Halorhodospira halophila]|uniref:nuclease domain-containing protein n=1 Tax=Halorhodospira halophila TaxID=1053 RepID=UPI001912227C|nr:nuclease domain-containing protein [Halorhodospira halophila]MBK5943336.1 hypothetical protein [Halorhodospira halophila]